MPDLSPDPIAPLGEAECWYPRSKQVPGQARRLLRELLDQVPGGERFAEEGELLVSELVTNALLHGAQSGQKIWVGLRVERDFLHIAVDDPSDEKPIPRQAGSEHEAGRGLLLLEALAVEWGCGAREGIGKRVWARLAPAPAVVEAGLAT